MTRRNLILFLGLTAILSISFVIGPGCANIIPPSGGPRDSLPPVLIRATPGDSSVNFSGNKISLTFDEYVDLDNFFQNAIISPIPKTMPGAIRRLNTITVRLHDELEPNTTYSINFGNSIKDFNEGNPMHNYTYVFSTGPAIDSLRYGGNVILAESGKIDTTLTIVLHTKAYDSAVAKEKPRYLAKLNGKGEFLFNNLPADTFYVYALQDDTRSLTYRDPRKFFAFADSPVIVSRKTRRDTLYAYRALKPAAAVVPAASSTNPADKRLKFQTTLRNNRQDILQDLSLLFDRPLRRFDSTKVHFSSDTIYTPVTGYHWIMDSTRKKLTLNYGWKENTLYHLVLEKDFAADTLGQQLLKADTLNFTTLKNTDYGLLSIRFRNLNRYVNPVLQFVRNDEVVNSYPLAGETFSQALFLPGEYELRILNDENKNGVWDPGEFFDKHKQPEIVKPVGRNINVKANWENEFEIAL